MLSSISFSITPVKYFHKFMVFTFRFQDLANMFSNCHKEMFLLNDIIMTVVIERINITLGIICIEA